MTAVSTVLYVAAEVIEKQGWTQGPEGMNPDRLPRCLMGAIAQAGNVDTFEVGEHVNTCERSYSYGAMERHPALRAVLEHLDLPDTSSAPWVWNDARGRTQGEVLEALRAAAFIAESREAYADPLELASARLGVPTPRD